MTSESFPPEIIREILLKATVKSLLRCKSVCKKWYSLISDQHFIKSHYTLSSTNNINYLHHNLFLSGYCHHITPEKNELRNNLKVCPLSEFMLHKSVSKALELEIPLQMTRPLSMVAIVGSCKGLVCLFVEDDHDDHRFFIYNPSTRICNVLPFLKGSDKPEWYSFGYDISTDDYKIVELYPVSFVKGRIYSLKTGMWKDLGDFCYRFPYSCGVFSNGALHWAVADGESPETQRIVSLDLAKETYGEVLQPVSDEGGMNLSLGVLGESLCRLCYYLNSHVDLWVMKFYGVKDSWAKVASIPYDMTKDWIDDYPVIPLFISNDGKMLFQSFLHLIIYDSKDGSKFRSYEACIVVESLVSHFPCLGLADIDDDENKGKKERNEEYG